MRGHDIESVDVGGVDIFANILLADHRFVDRRFDFADIYTDAARSVGLRVAVHEEYLFLKRGERGGKIDRSGRFPHPAFLVGDCDDFSHSDSLCPMLVRIGSCGKGKKKKVFHDVPRHFFTAHAFIVRLRSPLPPHSPHTLSNADRNSLAFSLAQDISTRSFAPARQHSARSCRLSFSTYRHGKKTSLVSVETRQLLAQSSPLFTRRSPLRSSLSLLHTRAYAHSIAFRLCLHLAGEIPSKH